jgi:hypothetical protein
MSYLLVRYVRRPTALANNDQDHIWAQLREKTPAKSAFGNQLGAFRINTG